MRYFEKFFLPYSLGLGEAGIHPRSAPFWISVLRIVSNDGGGFFSEERVAWEDIHAALEKSVPITSSSLANLFKQKSINTRGFLMAVLVKEKLVAPLPDKTRHFKLLDPEPFLDRVAKLAASAKPIAKKSVVQTPPPKENDVA